MIDASGICHPLRKPLGMKKNEITREDREKILELYVNFEENEHCKILTMLSSFIVNILSCSR